MPIVSRRPAFNGCAALRSQVLQRVPQFDFIEKFAGDRLAILVRQLLAKEVEPETLRLLENGDQDQPVRKIGQRGRS